MVNSFFAMISQIIGYVFPFLFSLYVFFEMKKGKLSPKFILSVYMIIIMLFLVGNLLFFLDGQHNFYQNFSEFLLEANREIVLTLIPFLLLLLSAFYKWIKDRKTTTNHIDQNDWEKGDYSLKKVILWGIGILIFMNLTVWLIFSVATSSSISNKNYYFERLDVAQLWEYSTGYNQTIAIIDSGITDEAMELFQDQIVSVFNSIDGSQNVLDENEIAHGTQMVSIIIGNGEAGVYGIAPSAQVIIVKAFEGLDSRSSGEALANAVDYAIYQEVDIINMSFGSFQVNDELEQAIERALETGIIVVAATGDYGNRDSLFPARMEGVISVRARDNNGNFWERSNIGENDVMSMYGVDILGLTFDNEATKMSGTSQATALTSGYIALIRDYYTRNDIQLSNDELLDILIELESNMEGYVDYLAPFRFD